MSHNGTAFHVAHGTGLPVPLRKIPHTPRRRESSAPPFLRRSPELLAALDAGPVVVPQVRTVKRVSDKPEKAKKPSASGHHRHVGTPRAKPLEPAAIEDICDLYRNGASLDQLAAKYRIDWKRARAELVKAGVPIRKHGGAHQRGELTPEQIESAIADYATGEGLRSMSTRYKIDRQRLSDILQEHGVTMRTRGGARPNRRTA